MCAHIECEVGSLYIESQMVESLKQMPFSTSIIVETSPELEKKKTKRDAHYYLLRNDGPLVVFVFLFFPCFLGEEGVTNMQRRGNVPCFHALADRSYTITPAE